MIIILSLSLTVSLIVSLYNTFYKANPTMGIYFLQMAIIIALIAINRNIKK